MKTWDAFISHASEDNESVVLPLVNILRKSGLTIWLDRTELRIGDSLLEKIDEGLAHSRSGIVILSRSFLSKGWTRKELNGLMAIEDGGQKVVRKRRFYPSHAWNAKAPQRPRSTKCWVVVCAR